MLRFIKKMPPGILVLFSVDLALTLIYLLSRPLHLPDKVSTFLDLDAEANLGSWYSSIQLFLVATMLGVFAFNRFDKEERKSWALLLWPLIFCLLSLDEIAQIHEWLGLGTDALLPGGTRFNTVLHLTGGWMFFLGIPFLAVMLMLLASLKQYLFDEAAIIKKLFLGLMIFVAASCGVEIIGNFVPYGGRAYFLNVSSEELGEMLGETLLVWASYELLRSCRFSLRFPKTSQH